MKLLFHCHSYSPHPASGADIYVERIATWLADRCNVKIIIDNCQSVYTYKNHIVESNKYRIAENYEWCDVVVTNLVTRNQAVWLAERFKKPIFHICHNATIPTLEQKPDNYIIYNSYWLEKERPLNFPSIVVQPSTWVKDWKKSKAGEYITLINLTANKGAELFYNVALNMPHLKFLAVMGGYGQQMRKPLTNIRYYPHNNDMQTVYDMTRILLVPSKSESWSLCAAEAQACGIPVVCSDLPGLRENLGDTAVYATGVRGFMDAVNMDLRMYVSAGLLNAKNKEKNHILQLENLYNFMEKATGKVTEKEKVIVQPVKEKAEFTVKPVKEKKVINKPTTNR